MTNAKQIARIIKTDQTNPGWFEYSLPGLGRIAVHCMPKSAAQWMGSKECVVRYGVRNQTSTNNIGSCVYWNHELQGSVEEVARKLSELSC